MKYLLLFYSLILVASSALFNNEPGTPSKQANRYFWDQFHQGHYDSIPQVLQQLESAYTGHSKDLRTTAHLGFAHLWAFCERGRKDLDPKLLSHIYASDKYLKEAMVLAPNDPRLKGFQAIVEMCEGMMELNDSKSLLAYSKSLIAIKSWPAFNKSAISFLESQKDTNTDMFRQGIKYEWEVIDDCTPRDLSKQKLLSAPEQELAELVNELKQTADPLTRRACWNTWIAPHNMEGFFLNFGDMLVKEGNADQAKIMYNAAKLSPSYDQWPYKQFLEERLEDINSNVKKFNNRLKQIFDPHSSDQIFINSKYSCMGCHQMSPAEFQSMGYQELGDSIYFLEGK